MTSTRNASSWDSGVTNSVIPFVIEQTGKEKFNRGALMNIGFLEANKVDNFDCFVFHDVDLVPEDDR